MKAVGYDQKIPLHQLDFVARNLTRLPLETLRHSLDDELRMDIKGVKSRENAHAIIMRTWCTVSEQHKAIKDYAAHIYPSLTKSEKILVHWCMTCLAYPFFKDEVNYIGKNFRLSDNLRSRTILAEMKNLYGDRRRVEVATSAVLSTLKNWELVSMSSPGIYHVQAERINIHSSELKMLMLEVLMNHLDTDSISIKFANSSAIFFPFDYYIRIGDLNQQRFSITNTIQDTIIERNPKIPYSL